jgi:hypothetical protein
MSERDIWRVWSRTLHRWGLQDFAVMFLEAFRPLALLGSQLLYIGQPLVRTEFSSSHLDALAHMLEDSRQTQAFIHFLREGSPQ